MNFERNSPGDAKGAAAGDAKGAAGAGDAKGAAGPPALRIVVLADADDDLGSFCCRIFFEIDM